MPHRALQFLTSLNSRKDRDLCIIGPVVNRPRPAAGRMQHTMREMSAYADFQVLMILTSQEQFGGLADAHPRRKTGLWLESFVAPYFLLRDAGINLTLASPLGGKPPVDPDSRLLSEAIASRFAEDECCRAALADTLTLKDVHALDFDAAFYPGGFGCYWDLTSNAASAGLISYLHAAGKPVAVVAQAVSALCPVFSAARRPLVEGRQVTGYTDRAARSDGVADRLPFSLEQSLTRQGAYWRSGDDPDRHVLQDGLLITGETVATSAAVAQVLLNAIALTTDTNPH
jgi:putative intracellular protease/amidase